MASWAVNVDTDNDGVVDLLGVQLHTVALNSSGAEVVATGVASLNSRVKGLGKAAPAMLQSAQNDHDKSSTHANLLLLTSFTERIASAITFSTGRMRGPTTKKDSQ